MKLQTVYIPAKEQHEYGYFFTPQELNKLLCNAYNLAECNVMSELEYINILKTSK